MLRHGSPVFGLPALYPKAFSPCPAPAGRGLFGPMSGATGLSVFLFDPIDRATDLARKLVEREGLWQKGHARVDHPVMNNRVARVTCCEKHPETKQSLDSAIRG
jgi:hypothetical protein